MFFDIIMKNSEGSMLVPVTAFRNFSIAVTGKSNLPQVNPFLKIYLQRRALKFCSMQN